MSALAAIDWTPGGSVTDAGIAEPRSLLPPRVAKAFSAMLTVSGRPSMSFDELLAFLRGLGLSKPESRQVVSCLRGRLNGASNLTLGDVDLLQSVTAETWIRTRRRELGSVFDTLLNAICGLTEQRTLSQVLTARGWTVSQSANVEHVVSHTRV